MGIPNLQTTWHILTLVAEGKMAMFGPLFSPIRDWSAVSGSCRLPGSDAGQHTDGQSASLLAIFSFNDAKTWWLGFALTFYFNMVCSWTQASWGDSCSSRTPWSPPLGGSNLSLSLHLPIPNGCTDALDFLDAHECPWLESSQAGGMAKPSQKISSA